MSRIPLVIVTATSSEAAAVRRALRVRARRSFDGARCWEGDGGGAALVRGGVGPDRAAAAARLALEAFPPAACLVLGFAGALRPAAAPGTLILADRTGVPGGAERPADPRLLRAAASAAAGIPALRGLLVTTESLAGTPEAKAALAAATGALAVDMESAVVASVAAEAGVPFLAARVIFDGADEPMHPVMMEVVRPDGTPRIFRAALLAARDREVRAALHWGGRRARLAARVLTRFCRSFLPLLGAGG